MTTADAEAWLAEETITDLPAGPVGLYEFVWALNGRRIGADAAARRRISAASLARVRAAAAVRLIELRWGEHTPVRVDVPWSEVTDRAWDDIGPDGTYLAVELTGGTT